MRAVAIWLAAAALVGAATGANATTYIGVQNIGGETVDLSITTDGVVRSLSTSDITGYSLSLSGPFGAFNLDGSGSPSYLISGSQTVATPTALTETITPYDLFKGEYAADITFYGSSGGNAIEVCFGNSCSEVIKDPSEPSGLDINQVPGDLIELNPLGTETYNNDYASEAVGTVITLGTVSSAPEPSAWALMIAGVAMVGGMMRTRARRSALLLGS